MIRLAQIGFLVGLVILLGLVTYHYPLIAAAGVAVAVLIGAALIGRA